MTNTMQDRPEIDHAGSTDNGKMPRLAAFPRPGEHVIVQCKGFRCLGYHDAAGKWRNVRTTQELIGVKGWHRIGDDALPPIP